MTTKTAKRLKEIIELKEIHKEIEKGFIGYVRFRTKIKNLIREIESVENETKT